MKKMGDAPRDGSRILCINKYGRWFISAWSAEVNGSGFGVIDSCCGYYEDAEPVAWTVFPEIPQEWFKIMIELSDVS